MDNGPYRRLLKKGVCLSEGISTPLSGLNICMSDQAKGLSQKCIYFLSLITRFTVEVRPCPILSYSMLWETTAFQTVLHLERHQF